MTEGGSSQPCMTGGHSDSGQKLMEALIRESRHTQEHFSHQGQSSSATGYPKSLYSLCPWRFSRADQSKFRESQSEIQH